MRIIKVTAVTPLDGFKLDLKFSDGTCGIASLYAAISECWAASPLVALLDEELWRLAHIKNGVVVWNDDIDIATETLYAYANGFERPKTGEEVEQMLMRR